MRSEYLEVSAVAKKLNVSTSTVYRLIQKNELKTKNVGASKAIRVIRASVEAFEHNRNCPAFD